MGQTTGFLTKSLRATTAIPARTIVTYGAADGTGIPAVAAVITPIGISAEIDTAVGENATVFMVGNIADVIYGGTVARGDALTSDATGRAVTTTTVGARCVGFAEVSGVINDIGTALITPFVY